MNPFDGFQTPNSFGVGTGEVVFVQAASRKKIGGYKINDLTRWFNIGSLKASLVRKSEGLDCEVYETGQFYHKAKFSALYNTSHMNE